MDVLLGHLIVPLIGTSKNRKETGPTITTRVVRHPFKCFQVSFYRYAHIAIHPYSTRFSSKLGLDS